MSSLAEPASIGGAISHCPPSVPAEFLLNLRVYKDVCHRIRSSLVAGRNDIVSPTTITRTLVKEKQEASCPNGAFIGEAPSAARSSDSGAEHDVSDEVNCPFLEEAEGWTIEYSGGTCETCGSNSVCVCSRPSTAISLRSLAEAAYREFFNGREHFNYYSEDPDIGPCVISIKKEDEISSDYRLLVRSSDHYLHSVVSSLILCGRNCDSVEEVIPFVAKEIGLSGVKPAHLPDLENELLRIDETFVKAHHKVGVLKVKEGQRNEEDIFCNCHENGSFDEFLNVLGGRVPLHGFKGFLGGLDNERNLTGELSVYSKFQDLEIMFHVATLLPFSPKDSQQVNKKRHIGNDIVCVVYLENSKTMFNPSWIRSHFIHCYVVVQHTLGVNGQPLYKVGVARRNNVPSFGPSLREGSVFAHSHTLQQLLLTKLVNAERASYHAPRFLKLTNRSRGQLLREITTSLGEYSMTCKQGRYSRKILKRSNWLPIGASRPPSPMMDSVQEKYVNTEKLAEDFSIALRGCELADVMFIVGEDRIPLYGVKAILACRSRVFRMMFKEFKPPGIGGRLSSPLIRRRAPTVSHQYMSPQNTRKSRIPGIGRMKKKRSVPEGLARMEETSSVAVAPSFCEDPRNLQIKEQYVVETFSDTVFLELLNYIMTGTCTIQSTNIVGLACAAEHYEIEELRQACHKQLPECLSVTTVCEILGQLEKHLSFSAAKTMIVQCLEFVDDHATEILSSDQFLSLSENMVHLVLRRDTDVSEILKVKAAFAWGEVNTKPRGPDFKTLVTPLVKHVRLHLIDSQDLMQILVPSEVFAMDKVMAALAYQVDPQSVELEDYTMFRPRKKSNVLSSR